MSIPYYIILTLKLGRGGRHFYTCIAMDNLEQAIKNFMDNLETVNELHHPNDYRRLYNIALIASLNGKNIPYDEMKEAFDKAINDREMNRKRFETAYPKYIQTIEVAYDIFNRIKENDYTISSDFRF